MALAAESQRSFRLYVTHVDGEGHFLKISGQLDHHSSLMVHSLLLSAHDNFDKGIGAVPPPTIHEGIICAVKYKDGNYYRAKIINTTDLSAGLVGVHFIDFGNKDIISLSAVRFLDIYDSIFLELPGQATDFFLTRIMHPSGRWDETLLLKLQSLLCNAEFPVAIEGQTCTKPIISLQYQGNDFTTYLVSNRFGIAVPVAKQEAMMMQPMESKSLELNGCLNSPNVHTATPAPTAPLQQFEIYKTRLLKVNSQFKVFVSFIEEGPELFAVQLVTDVKKLQDMTNDINMRPHISLAKPPTIGTVCLGKMSEDKIICRAIVMDVSGLQCKLFFVDFGDKEMVSYYDIFEIPEEFVKPNVFAMRFCLSGVKKLEKGPSLNEAFKQLVTGKVMRLRVVAPEGPPLIQYGKLYLDKKNVLDVLLANAKLQFKWMRKLPLGSSASVQVSYVDSCVKFYIQLSDKLSDLTAVMEAVKTHCERTSSPGELPVGAACCARFPDNGEWYRAKVLGSNNRRILVAYVDYGNEQEVDVSDLRTIRSDLIKLPVQALQCALIGFEHRPLVSETAYQLEMLALEKTLTAKIVGVVSGDTMLVSLVDDTTYPPLDVAREIVETKPNTPVSKAAPEQFSSPETEHGEGSKSQKSFREERRRDDEEFGRRGGSFQNSYTLLVHPKTSPEDGAWYHGQLETALEDAVNLLYTPVPYHGYKAQYKEFGELPDASNKLDELTANNGVDTKKEVDQDFEDVDDSSDPDLDDSAESTHTVIENKSFKATPHSLNDSGHHKEQPDSPKQDIQSSDTSKDSINMDAGHTISDGTKDSPEKVDNGTAEITAESGCVKVEIETKEVEIEIKEKNRN